MTPVKRKTLSGDVYDQLKELVMGGRMMPGEVISLRSMANALGVSVMPVREAMQRLVAEQALELTPKRTLRVPAMSVAQFKEITTIRLHLEGLASEMAAQRIEGTSLARIQGHHLAFASEMNREQPDGERLIGINKNLHFEVYRAAAMPVLLQMIEALWLRIGPILNYDLRSDSGRIKQRMAVAHHQRWMDALARRDTQAAGAALRGDIEDAAAYIVSAGVLVTEAPLS